VDTEMLWAQVVSYRDKGYLMGASVSSSSGAMVADTSAAEAMGLITDHAYSLLEAVQAGPFRLLKLRNPWGRGGWTGDYSRSSDPLWTPALRSACHGEKSVGALFAHHLCRTPGVNRTARAVALTP